MVRSLNIWLRFWSLNLLVPDGDESRDESRRHRVDARRQTDVDLPTRQTLAPRHRDLKFFISSKIYLFIF